MSPSMSSVRCPPSAKVSARFADTNDLPSPGSGLVTVMTRGPGPYSCATLSRTPRSASTTSTGYLLRIPQSGIDAVEHDGSHDTQSQAQHEADEEEAWLGVLDRTLRHDRRIENPDIRNRGFRGKPRLIVALLQRRVGLFLQLCVAAEPDLLDRPGRNPAEIDGRGIHLPAHLRFACGELRDQVPRECRDGALLELRNLAHEALQGRIFVGVVVAIGAQLRLLVTQLLKGIRQLWRVLYGHDGRECIHRQRRVRQEALDRLAVATQLIPVALHVEEVRADGITRLADSSPAVRLL